MYKYACMILIGSLTVSCATVSNVSVKNASESGALPQGSFIYALPQTIVDISVVAEEISIVPGPYEKYANKYLGIENAPTKAEKFFNLKSIRISRHLEADPDFIYSVSGSSDLLSRPDLKSLIEDSLILSAANFANNQATTFKLPTQNNDILYTDLSIKRNFEAEKDVEISMVLPDTDYESRPQSSRTTLKEKSIEQKAEEAANFLIKLKKRRFKLVAGQYDYMPDGESMSAALQELGRIEQEYLALFIGRRITNEVQRNFHFSPEPGENNKRIVLFRFSPTQGFVGAGDSEGIPVVIDLQAMNKTRELGNVKLPVKLQPNMIPYRIADQVNIKILAGEQVWAEAIYPVFQYGTPVSLTLVK